jgi:hypothetical protein
MVDQMEKDIQDLVFNLMCDLKKREIEPIGRARLIQSYLDSAGLSGRQLASRLGIPHSTMQDWLRWNRMSQEDYNGYIKAGHSHLDIYKSLRGGTLSGKEVAIDIALQNCISKMMIFKLKPPFSHDTKGLIKKLKNILNVIDGQVK